MSVSVTEAGRNGGLTVLTKYGRDYYVQLGRKGQLSMRARYPNMAREWGKRGGRPRKPKLGDVMGNKSE